MMFLVKNTYYLKVILLCIFPFLSSCDSGVQVAEYDLDDRVDVSDVIGQPADKELSNIYIFSFDLRASPQEDARQYLPFLKYLERETGYQFKLRFTSKNRNIVDEVGTNHVQFAALGAVSFLKANTHYDVVPVVRGLNFENKAEYQSVFVVSPDSKIKSLSEIRDKRLAFGSRSSTQGHLIPRIVLNKNNIELQAFSSIVFTGSHQNCANSVISKKADVCAMQDTMAKNMEKKNLLRIIHSSSNYPSSGIVANRNVSKEVLTKVKQALINFKPQGKHKSGLYHWERTEMPLGFTSAHINDYSELKKWAVRLGFIQKPLVNNE